MWHSYLNKTESIIKTQHLISVIFLLSSLSFAQVDKSIELKEFSFGKAWFYNDTSDAIGIGDNRDKVGIVNANYWYSISDITLDGNFVEKVLKASELKYIWLTRIEIDDFLTSSFFRDSIISINKPIWMIQSKISEMFYLKNIRFLESVYLSGNDFYSRGWVNQIDSCVFENKFTANEDSFLLSEFNISNSQFNDDVELRNNYYKYNLEIDSSEFRLSLDLSASNFQQELLIQDSKIRNLTITGTTFIVKPVFRRIELVDTVDFSNTDFEKGVDLRRIDFKKVSTIFLDNTYFPPGELIMYWEYIQGDEIPKISLKFKSGISEDDFKSIEEIYLQIKNNFLAQGDKTSADEVMYELAWQKEIIVGGIWQWLYGVTLGYGYAPVRYLFFPILLTVLLFWFIWYKFYYNIVAYILNKELDSELGLSDNYHVEFPTKKIKKIVLVDHKRLNKHINFVTRYWHCLHFSVSVLIGLRFKKEWMPLSIKYKYRKNSFLWMTTLEYALGKIYLVLLLIFIKIHYFENWKSFLGL